ncbi:MAG: MarR family winged helix-turn-helix transcriptional regulator [Pseudobdellovibrionaceae bacterium]|jgi:DNA-binding MarR family transcriptional regulator|uniref:MarR family winged helix-turn-helix transcriptional regulator n=1 Tax=Candidatus Methylopumilus planktonicus TaxID=1581557 RepID=UPI003BE1F0C1
MTTKLPISATKISKECICFSLKKAERLISRRYDEALAPFGLRNGQFSMLICISGANLINIQSIAHQLNMDRTTTTAALKPLEKRKLIKITASKEDSRVKLVSITPLGISLLTKAIPAWQKIQDQMKADINLDNFIKLKDQLSLLH